MSELKELKERLCYWRKAEDMLLNASSYEEVLAALHPDDQEEWKTEYVGAPITDYSKAIYTETRDSLQHWILFDGIPYYEKRIYELESREQVKTQALGQTFLSGDMLEKYTRYENHLDRKFEKTLSMLIRLQELRDKCFVPAPKLA